MIRHDKILEELLDDLDELEEWIIHESGEIDPEGKGEIHLKTLGLTREAATSQAEALKLCARMLAEETEDARREIRYQKDLEALVSLRLQLTELDSNSNAAAACRGAIIRLEKRTDRSVAPMRNKGDHLVR